MYMCILVNILHLLSVNSNFILNKIFQIRYLKSREYENVSSSRDVTEYVLALQIMNARILSLNLHHVTYAFDL